MPMVSKLGRMITYYDGLLLFKVTCARSRHTQKYYIFTTIVMVTYGHQTCKDGDLTWGAPNPKVI